MTTNPNDIYQCDNCGYREKRDRADHADHLDQRLTPGGVYTDKQCSRCGALTYPIELEGEPS